MQPERESRHCSGGELPRQAIEGHPPPLSPDFPRSVGQSLTGAGVHGHGTQPTKTEFDSAVIRVEMLKRFQITAQSKTGDDEGRSLELDGKSVRIDPRERELSKHPFGRA